MAAEQEDAEEGENEAPLSQVFGLPTTGAAPPPPPPPPVRMPETIEEETAHDDPLGGLPGFGGGEDRTRRPKRRDKGGSKGEGTTGRAAAVVVSSADTVDRTPELHRHIKRFKACVPPGTVATPTRVTIKANVAGDGSFRGAQVIGGGGLPAQVSGCLKDTIHAIRVTPPEGEGAIVVELPLMLGGS